VVEVEVEVERGFTGGAEDRRVAEGKPGNDT
jgi:hypothetical protein